MKTNKIAILGMLVAMIMSLGVMKGVNYKKNIPETNLVWVLGSAFATHELDSTEGEILLGLYGVCISAAAGAMYGSLFSPGIGTLVGGIVGA